MPRNANEIVLFESSDAQVSLPVSVVGDTVWLTRNQMAMLFGRDAKTVGRHVNIAFAEELDGALNPVVAKFATVQTEGSREVERQVERPRGRDHHDCRVQPHKEKEAMVALVTSFLSPQFA